MQQVLNYKCPGCGAPLEFSSATQKWDCKSCGNSFDLDTITKLYDAQQLGSADPQWEQYAPQTEGGWKDGETDNICSYTCPSCGAEIITDANTAATHCVYCGNPTVLPGRLSGQLRPDYVIGFKLDKAAAEAAFKKHCEGKRLLPSDFTSQNRVEKISGVYVPFWLFDCEADASMTYNATRVSTTRSGDYRITSTSHYMIRRDGDVRFDKLPVDGSSKLDDTLMESIEPYDYSALAEFNPAYLSGYLADKYDVDAQAGMPRANERIKKSVDACFMSTVEGYASVVPASSNISLKNGAIHYALLPVWMLNTIYNGKMYTFAMNGQTGKMVGDLPIDRGKYWKWLLGGIAALAAGGYLIDVLLKLLEVL